jgi:hypothetical protein
LKWSSEQLAFYQELLRKIAGQPSWAAIAAACFPEFSPTAPASDESIAICEHRLGRKLPEGLRSLYLECNGIDALYRKPVMCIEDIVARNEELRSNAAYSGLYMPFENLFFFGEEGNGDLYGFAVRKDGTYAYENVFEWNHENDSRSWKANGLKDLLVRVATEFCC